MLAFLSLSPASFSTTFNNLIAVSPATFPPPHPPQATAIARLAGLLGPTFAQCIPAALEVLVPIMQTQQEVNLLHANEPYDPQPGYQEVKKKRAAAVGCGGGGWRRGGGRRLDCAASVVDWGKRGAGMTGGGYWRWLCGFKEHSMSVIVIVVVNVIG